MSNVLKCSLVIAALLSSQAAHAGNTYSPTGSHNYTGSLALSKNLPFISNCTISLDIDVDAATNIGTISAPTIGGAGLGCDKINFIGSSFALNSSNPGTTALLTTGTMRIEIDEISPYSGEDACEGTLSFILTPGILGSDLTFTSPTSDIPDAAPNGNYGTTTNPCIIEGTLSGPALTAL